jgi:chromosome segregation ATPase
MAKLDQISESIGELRATVEGQGKKLDEMVRQMSRQNDILSENTSSLKEHMSQTLMVREQTSMLRQDHERFQKAVDERMKPMETHITEINTLSKIAKWFIALVAVPESLYFCYQVAEALLKHLR